MSESRAQAISELEKLWKAVFGGPPAVKSEAGTLAQFLVDHLPPAPAYRPGLAAGQAQEMILGVEAADEVPADPARAA